MSRRGSPRAALATIDGMESRLGRRAKVEWEIRTKTDLAPSMERFLCDHESSVSLGLPLP